MLVRLGCALEAGKASGSCLFLPLLTVTVAGEIENVKQIDNKYLPKAASIWVAGELPGSLRTIHAREEDEEYKLGFGALATGFDSKASGDSSHTEGYGSTASGWTSHAEGYGSFAAGEGSHAEGGDTEASGNCSHAEGENTIAGSDCQHVQGKYNIEDTEDKYAHIVGNGVRNIDFTFQRSNAHTLDWDGNAWYAGAIEGTAVILRSSTPGSTKKFKLTIGDDGILSTEELTE
jgi:hypothetical protein